MSRFQNLETNIIVGDAIADRPAAGAPGLEGGTIFRDLATGEAWLYVTTPGGNAWVPFVGFGGLRPGASLKFNMYWQRTATGASGHDLADDYDLADDEVLDQVVYPLVAPARGEGLINVYVTENSLTVASVLAVRINGVDVPATIAINAGQTGDFAATLVLPAFVSGERLNVQLRTAAGALGEGDETIRIGAVLFLPS